MLRTFRYWILVLFKFIPLVIDFISGMFLYYRWKFTGIYSFIKFKSQQIKHRFRVQNEECKNSGKCIACGCHSKGMLFITRGCELGCYPKLFKDKNDWEYYKDSWTVVSCNDSSGNFVVYYKDGTTTTHPIQYKDIILEKIKKDTLLSIKSLDI